MTVGDAVRWSH